MKNFLNFTHSIFIFSVPFLIFFKPQNYIEMIRSEIIYLLLLLFALFSIALILSLGISKIFKEKLKYLSLNNQIIIWGVVFFEIFYHEKVRDLIINNLNFSTIYAFILSLIIIFLINFLTIIILIKYINKVKINILIFMILLLSVSHFNNFNLYKSKLKGGGDLTYFKKSDLPKKKLNQNIYLVILDEMTNLEDFVNQFPNEKNYINNFKKKIEEKEFKILEKSLAAYNLTYLNLTALVNANYFINENSPKYISRNSFFPNSIFYKTKNSVQVLDYLQKNNHFMEMIGNSEMNFELISSENNLKLNNSSILIPNIFYKFFEPTFVDELFRRLVQDYLVKTDQSIFIKNNGMGVLKKKMKFRKDNGLFFVHHFSPHAPYLFNRNCKERSNFDENPNPKKYNSDLYKESYICVTKQIIKLIDKINEYDKDGIIIFQGDHSNFRDRTAIERFFIFNAIRVPRSCNNYLDQRLSNINTFRVALYCSSNEKPILYNNNSYVGFHGDEKLYGTLKKIK